MAEKSQVRYQPPSQDGGRLRTHEQQALLLSKAAYAVWERWAELDHLQGDETFNAKMRVLYKQVSEHDVFYSGYALGREESDR